MVHRDVITEEQSTSCWPTTIIMCKGKHTATSLGLSHSSALHFLAKVKELVIAWTSVSESTEMGPQSSYWHPKAHTCIQSSISHNNYLCRLEGNLYYWLSEQICEFVRHKDSPLKVWNQKPKQWKHADSALPKMTKVIQLAWKYIITWGWIWGKPMDFTGGSYSRWAILCHHFLWLSCGAVSLPSTVES